MNYQIKYFTEREEIKFFTLLESDVRMAKTPYAKKKAIRDAALFNIMYYCALRVTETTNLETTDFNDLKNELYCKRIKGGKNNTLRIVNGNVLRALKRHLRYNTPHIYLFENMHHNTQLSRKTIYSNMKKLMVRIHLEEKGHPHTLRHTRAIDLIESGCTIYEIQYWLGHVDISNTQIYLDFTAKQQEHIYKKLLRKKGY